MTLITDVFSGIVFVPYNGRPYNVIHVIHVNTLITDALITDDVPYNGRFFKVPTVRYEEQGVNPMGRKGEQKWRVG